MYYMLLSLLPLIMAMGCAFIYGANKLWDFGLPLDQIAGILATIGVGIALINPLDYEQRRLTYGFFDDFSSYTDATGIWTKTDADTGATAAIDADNGNGEFVLTTGATDNNEAYIESREHFDWVADKPMLAACALSYTEANTDDANVCFGFADAPGANTLVDDGAGIKASFSGAVIYKVDGGTVWKFITSKGATQTISTSDKTAGGAQELKIEIRMLDAAECEAVPYVDGAQLRDTNGVNIKHRFNYTSATQQAVFAGAKAGGANSEVVSIDWIAGYRKR